MKNWYDVERVFILKFVVPVVGSYCFIGCTCSVHIVELNACSCTFLLIMMLLQML